MPVAVDIGKFWFGGVFPLAVAAAGIALFVAVAALSHAHERPFSAALIYLGLGLVADVVLRAGGLGEGIDPVADHLALEHLTAVAVVIALFATGMRVGAPLRDRRWRLTGRLLCGAMPLTIAAVAVWGTVLMDLPLGAALVLGAALAPTDPVLAGGLGARPPGEDDPTEDREFAISTEAGLNDGLALPFLLLGLLIYEAGDAGGSGAEFVAVNALYAVPVPLVLGYLAGRGLAALVTVLRGRGFLSVQFDPWIGLASAPLVYGVAELISTYGFLAVVAAGYGFRRHEVDHEAHEGVHAGVEQVQHFAELTVILLLGVMVTLDGFEVPGLGGWLLVPALLLLIRPGVTLASLARTGLDRRDRSFIAWFGVKGVASLNYLFVALGVGVMTEGDERTVAWTVLFAVMVSIVVHGVTATPAMRRLA